MYLFGIPIKEKIKIREGLSSIYGIGRKRADDITTQLKFSDQMIMSDLTRHDINLIAKIIADDYVVESELRKLERSEIHRLMSVRSYRGVRHRQGLPLRGQRTHTNGKTQKKLASKRR